MPTADLRQDLAALLASLDESAQTELFNALAYKRQRINAMPPTREQEDYWSALCEAIELPAHRRPHLGAFLQTYGRARFDEKVAELNAMIEDSCGPVMRAPQRQAVRVQVLKAVVSYLRRREIACTPKTVMNSSTMAMSDAVDQAYPGYARAKLLHRVAPLARGLQAMRSAA